MRLTPSRTLEDALAGVYGVALAASADADAAADAVAEVFGADPSGWRVRPTDDLAARVARHAVRSAPHPAFAAMEADDREAIVLARLLGWSVSRIGDELLLDAAEVRRRLTRALRAVAAAESLLLAA